MAVTAQFKADFSTFSDAVRKADAQLADFAKGAGTVEKSLARMTDNFSGRKLIQEAALMTKAIEDAGGIAALTGKQLQEAGAKASEAADKMHRLGMEVPAGLKAVSDAAQSGAGFFSQLGGEVARTAAGFVSAQAIIGAVKMAVGTLTDFVKSSVSAFAEQEAATVKMVSALRQHGLATPRVIQQYKDLSSEFQQQTVFADELIQANEALLTQVGNLMPSQMRGALKASTDLAAGLGIDLQSATMLVAKAAAGHTETLGRYGITVSEAALKTQGFDAVLEAINRQFGGSAAAQLDTYSGKVARMGNMWGEFKERIGEAVVTSAAGKAVMIGLTDATNELGKENGSLVKAFGDLVYSGFLLSNKWGREYLVTLDAVRSATQKLDAMPNPFDKTLKSLDPLPGMLARGRAALADWDEERKQQTKSEEEAARVAAKVAAAAKELADAEKLLAYQVVGVGAAEDGLALRLEVREKFQQLLNERSAQYYERLTALVPAQKDWWTQLQQSDEVTIHITEHAELMGAALEHIGTKATATFRPVITTAQKVSSVFGDIDSILSNIPGKFAEIGAVAARTGEAIIKNLGNPWAMVIAGAVGAIQVIKQLFGGPSKEELAARDTWAKFAQQFSDVKGRALSLGETIQAIADKLVLAGKTGPDALAMIQVALDATHVSAEAEAAALQHINDVLNDYQADQTRANELIAEYQIGIEKLGPAWRNQQLDEQATSLVNDYRIMLGVLGLSVPDAVELMGDKFNDFLQIALKTGAEIPIGMKPVLEQMAKYGELTDLNGEKITDLSQENITWSMTMSQGFQKVIDKLTEFMDKLFGTSSVIEKIGRAAQDLPDNPFKNWQIPPGPSIPDMSPSFAAAGGRVTSSGVQYLASGGLLRMMGRGSDTVPAMLTPGEGVVSRKGMGVLGNAGLAALNRGHGLGGGGGNIFAPVIHVNAQGAHFRTPADRRRLADDVGDAVREIYDRQRRTA